MKENARRKIPQWIEKNPVKYKPYYNKDGFDPDLVLKRRRMNCSDRVRELKK